MPSAVLVSSHSWTSRRRAGFHWIADALHSSGWQVAFVTVGFSWLSHLKDDHRHREEAHRSANRPIGVAPALVSYVWYTPFHPLNRLPGLGNLLLGPLFRGYDRLPMPGLERIVAAADLLIFESTSGLMLVDRFRGWNPKGRFVYRASDDLRLLRAHPVVLEAEARALPRFDLVSVPSEYIRRQLAAHSHVMVHPHGIDSAPFDTASTDPYDRSFDCHAVFVGTSHLDTDFLVAAARSFPSWQFHVIGPLRVAPALPNVISHGEMPFDATVPFITHSDIGLAARSYAPGAESLTDSLKVIQYTYVGLPIVAPDFLNSTRSNVFTYRPGDPHSIREALLAARGFDRSTVDRSGIGSWTDLARSLAGPELWP